jgi:cytochrome c-type biogenesis protein CcmF
MLYPAKWFYRKHEQEPTTEVGIRRTLAEDLYIVMPAFEISELTASVEVHINPLVNWIWMGFGILALGTGIALLPERAISFAAARVPAGEAVTAAIVVLALFLFPAGVRAQHVERPQDARLQVFSKEVRDVTRKLACWCGGCSKLPVGDCACSHCALVKNEVTAMVKEQKSEAEIIQHFVAPGDDIDNDAHRGASGQVLLSEPIAGAGRFFWLIPYVLGLAGAAGALALAVVWSRRPKLAGPAAMLEDDVALSARLDDELRDLD